MSNQDSLPTEKNSFNFFSASTFPTSKTTIGQSSFKDSFYSQKGWKIAMIERKRGSQ
jgi:hypothetical protein